MINRNNKYKSIDSIKLNINKKSILKVVIGALLTITLMSVCGN